MRITQDAIDSLNNGKLEKAVENAKSEDRTTIRKEDLV